MTFLPFFSSVQILPSPLPLVPSIVTSLTLKLRTVFLLLCKIYTFNLLSLLFMLYVCNVTIIALGEVCVCSSFLMSLTHFVKNCLGLHFELRLNLLALLDFILSLDSTFLNCWHTLHLP